MAENISSRVARIIASSIHGLLDAVEDRAPELVMEQAIREIDGAVDDVRAELGKAAANKHLANMRLMETNAKHEELSAQIEVALAKKREDLAEAAISRQLDLEAQVPVLENAIADAAGREKELQGFIAALAGKKREMQEALAQYVASRVQQPATMPTQTGGDSVSGRVERAQSAFDRALSRQTGLPGMPAAADRATAASLTELNELARKNRVQERLAALKAKS